jgi:hypothetical protein
MINGKCWQLLSAIVSYCQLFSTVVSCCQLLSAVVNCCQLLAAVGSCCQLLSAGWPKLVGPKDAGRLQMDSRAGQVAAAAVALRAWLARRRRLEGKSLSHRPA